MLSQRVDDQGSAVECDFLDFAMESVQQWLQGNGINLYSGKDIATHADQQRSSACLVIGPVVGYVGLNFCHRGETYILAGAGMVDVQNQVRGGCSGVVGQSEISHLIELYIVAGDRDLLKILAIAHPHLPLVRLRLDAGGICRPGVEGKTKFFLDSTLGRAALDQTVK